MLLLLLFVVCSTAAYIKQCRRDDPKLVDCFSASLEHLKPYLASGIPEIEVCNPSARGMWHAPCTYLHC